LAQELEQSAPTHAPSLDGVGTGHVGGGAAHRSALAAAGSRQIDNELGAGSSGAGTIGSTVTTTVAAVAAAAAGSDMKTLAKEQPKLGRSQRVSWT